MRIERKNDNHSLGNVVANAARWSMLTQLASKLIAPITTIVLARFLTPEAFGVVALSTMVTSLSNMFSDAGFQRYLVQEAFSNKTEEGQYASVAFWSNMIVSCIAVLFITVFRDWLAAFLGSPNIGLMLAVSSLSLPLTALSGVQTALYQKHLDFKTLFGSRFGSSLLIFVVAVPMALMGCSYWSLVIGTLANEVFLVIWLTVLSDWKPSLFYDFHMLVDMLSYGVWILIESFATWLNTWLGTFIISRLLSEMYVGYYNTSVNMASSITGIVTAAILPVAFATFAKVKYDSGRFERVFFLMQKYLAMCIIPVAVGCLVYRNLITIVLLGDQWLPVATFFGCWMFVGSTVIVFGNLCSEAYRACGMPKWCVIVQVIYLIPFVPTLYVGASLGFDAFSVIVPVGRFSLCIIHLIVAKIALGLSPLRIVTNLKWTYLQTALSIIPGIVVSILGASIVWQLMAAMISVCVYLVLIYMVETTRQDAQYLLEKFFHKQTSKQISNSDR